MNDSNEARAASLGFFNELSGIGDASLLKHCEGHDELRLFGEVGSPLAAFGFAAFDSLGVSRALDERDPSVSLVVRLNSPGGDPREGAAIAAMLARAAPLEIEIAGLCASAATLIACAPGAKVTMAPGSLYMIHNGYFPDGSIGGDAEELRRHAAELDKNSEAVAQVYAMRTGQSAARMRELMDAETWLSPEDALEWGFIDGISGQEVEIAPANDALMSAGTRMRMLVQLPDPKEIEMQKKEPEAVTGHASAEKPVAETAMAPAAEAPEKAAMAAQPEKAAPRAAPTVEELEKAFPELCARIASKGADAERARLRSLDEIESASNREFIMQAKYGEERLDAREAAYRLLMAAKKQAAETVAAMREETAAASEAVTPQAEMSDDDQRQALISEITKYMK